VIARISRGLPWPDGSGKAPLGSCIILSAEDNTEDTIAPRLTAAGADLSKVYIVDAVEVVDGSSRSFSLATDLNQLAQLVETIGDVALIMIDPITAYLGADLDSHRTTAVRAVMQPVDKFAAEHEVAILGITHPPKATQSKAIHSFTGSLAFIAAARTGFIVVTEDDTDRRLLLAVKNNVGPMAHGLGYVIEPVTTPAAIKTSRIVWDGLPVTMSADEAIQVSNHRDKGDERVEAENFLRGYLENGPMPADQVKAAAKENGISERTLWRAKKQVGVVAEKGSYKEGWRWRLPETWRPAGWAGG
jgi:putative DNA primase/helicase